MTKYFLMASEDRYMLSGLNLNFGIRLASLTSSLFYSNSFLRHFCEFICLSLLETVKNLPKAPAFQSMILWILSVFCSRTCIETCKLSSITLLAIHWTKHYELSGSFGFTCKLEVILDHHSEGLKSLLNY